METKTLANKPTRRLAYIDGLKGAACIMIFAVGHWKMIYTWAESFNSIPWIEAILSSPFSFILNADFWFNMFLVISGYLVAKSDIKNIKEVIVKCITRFFRLAFPILFVCFIIYLLYLVCGFYNSATVKLFRCDWFQSFYHNSYSLKDVLYSPYKILIISDKDMNPPYWVLKKMFISSLMIYFFKYLIYKLMPKHERACFACLIVLTMLLPCFHSFIIACLAGMFVELFEHEEITSKPYFALWMLSIFALLYWLPPVLLHLFVLGALILYMPRIKWLERICSSRPLTFLGDLSWGIYSFHWPLACSVGALAMIKLSGSMGLTKAYGVSFLIVLALTFIISIIYHHTFEKLASYITMKINVFLKKLIN